MNEKNNLSEVPMSNREHKLRMTIRKAYLVESLEDLRAEAVVRGKKGRWFEVACLLELASED